MVEVERVEERAVGASRSGCSLVEGRLGRPWTDRCWRCFVLEEVDDGEAGFVGRSLSRSRSFSLKGRNMAWKRLGSNGRGKWERECVGERDWSSVFS